MLKTTGKIFFSALVAFTLTLTGYFFVLNPEAVSADTSTSSSIVVTLNVTAGISITSPSNITMSQTLGVTANTAVGTSTWNVKTNDVSGYNLTLKASTAPAMQNASSSVADYAIGAPTPWSVVNSAKFGFSAYGTDVNPGTWGTVGAANCSAVGTAHVPSGTLNYLGFTTSTSSPVVATRAATTTTSGVDTTVCFAVEQNNVYIPSGTYTATITATAVTL